ncbi:MAG TPA: branched-chain amino acid ABC transporter permease [Chloroflexota bacterium]|jgi:branched-chain amino acid transport system permease protein|nr:branched-chain amino acid ABC transporter permease [Chloroflexota bacterium]
MTVWAIQGLNALSYGILLYLVSVGLTLTLGLLRIINLTHGSYYLLGGYLGLVTIEVTGSFLAGLCVAGVAMMALGLATERLLFRRYSDNEPAQVLLSLGLLFLLGDIALGIWGGTARTIRPPELLAGAVPIGSQQFPSYRLALIGVGLLVAIGLWILLERTRLGLMVRAAVDDPELAQAMRVNVPLVMAGVFSLGALLAGVAGTLGGPIVGMYPGGDFDILLLATVIVILGGMGSLRGAFLGALLIGIIDTIGRSSFPELSLFAIFAPMAAILVLRPQGLFGRAF